MSLGYSSGQSVTQLERHCRNKLFKHKTPVYDEEYKIFDREQSTLGASFSSIKIQRTK